MRFDKPFSFGALAEAILTFVRNLKLRVGRIILIGLTMVLALFGFLAFLQFGFIYWIYTVVENWITVRLGFDYYLAGLFATVFVSVFTILTPTLAWYILLGKKRAWGIGVMIGIQALMCLSVYTLGSRICFDRRSGKPLCYFADTPQGRVWSYTPGFDPESGKEFQLYTREIKEIEELRKQLPVNKKSR
ncbi:MAG: hypothetical protein WA584_19855 [Pyrinomonadaceae bacterium]